MKKTMIIATLLTAGVAAYLINRKRGSSGGEDHAGMATQRNKSRHRTNIFHKSKHHEEA